MLHIILNIIMWILIVFLVVLVVFWTYGMITSKEFREANNEGWKASVRERKKSKTFDNIFAFILIAIFLFLLLSL